MTSAEIRSERERQGLSQEALARLLGVTTSAVVKWESGARTPSGAALTLLRLWADGKVSGRADGY